MPALEFLENIKKELPLSHKLVRNSSVIKQNAQVRVFLMQNSKIAFYIENPAYELFKKNEINEKEFEAANLYCQLYAVSIKDNMSKPAYEANFGFGGGKPSKREPSDHQIDAAKRIYKMKQKAGEELAGVLEMFLEKEICLKRIAKLKRCRFSTAKKLVIESLQALVSQRF